MAERRTSVLDIRELIRRFRKDQHDRQVARDLSVSRNTVKKYREWAQKEGFLDSPKAPTVALVQERLKASMPAPPLGPTSTVEPYRELVTAKRTEGVELRALHQLLKEQGFTGSYSALRRFVGRLEILAPKTFLRVETPPGKEMQVDFGYVGRIFDAATGKLRKAWVFVVTLCFSRHMYAEIVFDQRVQTWVELHVRAFEFFGGVTERVVIDNLRAGIVRAVLHDVEAQQSYRELAEHYDFLIAPCRPRTPEHKGKVESDVHYVKRNALAGRTFPSLEAANEHIMGWIHKIAGRRVHGTTQEPPLERFEREKRFLKKLPQERYEVCVWKEAKVHPDCHVVFEYSYYSVPFRLAGRKVMLRVLPRRVEVYFRHERLATHPRAAGRGVWVTSRDHLPPEKIQGLLAEPIHVRRRAKGIGTATEEVVERLLGSRPVDRLRSAMAILNFSRKYGTERLEAACRRALSFEDVRYLTIKTILHKGLDLQPLQETGPGPLPRTSLFARPPTDFEQRTF